MANIEVTVPDLGVDEAVEVIEICVEVGQTIEKEEPVAVLESDKATMEIPSSEGGKVSEILISVGDKVSQGDKLLLLESEAGTKGGGSNASSETETKSKTESRAEDETSETEAQETSTASEEGDKEVDVFVPDIGGAEQVEVIEISVSEGDEIETEQTVLVLESDKATMEIPSPNAGKIKQIKVKVGDQVAEGDLIAIMTARGSSAEDSSSPKDKDKDREATISETASTPLSGGDDPIRAAKRSEVDAIDRSAHSGHAHAGPAVRKLARELGLDLSLVEGSGRKGRVLKDDVKAYVKNRLSGDGLSAGNSVATLQQVPLPDFSVFGDTNVEAMDKLQKMTALNMQRSWSTVPHVTQFDEADITDLESFRKSKKAEAEKLGVKLTPLPFILKACAHALEKYPQFNVSLDMAAQTLIQKKYIHIGIAVDTPAGLVVPVLRDVDKKTVWQLAEECQVLAAKARDRKLKPADMQGGCFTISSLGSIGGTAFTPIVNAPEVAILGVSRAEYQPKYNGSEFEPRLMLPLSLSYDHRAVNGVDGAKFTSHLASVLADIRELLF